MKKKIMSILLAIGLIMSMSITTFALSDDDIDGFQLDNPVDTLNPDDFIEANEEIMRLGNQILDQAENGISPRAHVILNIAKLYQNNQTWSNDIMKTRNSTIGAEGCTLTSFTMVQRYLGGKLDPGEVNTKLGDSACPFDWAPAATKFNYEIVNYKRGQVSDYDAKSFIVGSLNMGRPVIVGFKNSSGSTHYVLATGYFDDEIYINDPSQQRDYGNINEYLSDYYVERLYVYDK